MIVGVTKKIKKDEHRIALAPAAVEAISAAGHTVLSQKGAGFGAGSEDRAENHRPPYQSDSGSSHEGELT